MTKNKYFVPTLAFLTDAALAFYTYLLCTDYKKFQEIAKITIRDPDFQLEIYKVLLQTLTFILLLFLFFHLIIYILFYRGKNFARKYVRFYLIVAIGSLGLSILFSFNIYFVFALVAFLICFRGLKTAE